MTQTPAAEVWMRPWLSVTGTRWTRWTPPSYFSRAQGPSPGPGALPEMIRTWTSLYPPRSDSVESSSSMRQPRRSA